MGITTESHLIHLGVSCEKNLFTVSDISPDQERQSRCEEYKWDWKINTFLLNVRRDRFRG